MSGAISELQLKFMANVAEFKSDMKEIKKTTEETKESFEKFGEAVKEGLEAFAVIEGVKKFIEITNDAEATSAKLEQRLTSTGQAAGVTKTQVEELAEEMRKLTGISQDQIATAEGVLLAYNKIGKEAFPQALKATLDLSRALNIDLTAAAKQVGSVFENPAKALTRFNREGIGITQSQIDLVQSLAKTGHQAEATAEAMDILSRQTSGQSDAFRNTLPGAIQATESSLEALVETMGGNNGLRKTVEATNLGLEHLIETVKELKNPTTEIGKEFENFGKGVGGSFNLAIESTKNFSNIVIGDLDALGQATSRLWKSEADAVGQFVGVLGLFAPTLQGPLKTIDGALKTVGYAFTHFNENTEKMVKDGQLTDYIAHIFDPMLKNINEVGAKVDARIEETKKRAESAKPVGPAQDEDGPTKAQLAALKKIQTELQREQTQVDNIVKAYEKKNNDLAQEANGHKKLNDLLDAEAKINAEKNLSDKAKQEAITKLIKLETERQAIEKQIAQNNEKTKLEEVLKNLQDQNAASELKLVKEKSLIPILEAQAKIRDIVKIGSKEELALQQKITDEAQKQSDLIKQQEHADSLKAAQSMSDELEKQLGQLQAQRDGTEDLVELKQKEADIEKLIGLSDSEKADAIKKIEDETSQIKLLNQQLEQEKNNLEDIKASSKNVEDEKKKLYDAYQAGNISAKQWNDTLGDINRSQEKNKESGHSFGATVAADFEKLATSGKNFKETLVDIGKELLKLTEEKLLVKPLENLINNVGDAITGNGSATGGHGLIGLVQDHSKYSAGGGVGVPQGTGLNQQGFSQPVGNATGYGNNLSSGTSSSSDGSLLDALKKLITGKAVGGAIQAGKPYLVGEQGPELIVPGQSAYVNTAEQTKSIYDDMPTGPWMNGNGQYEPFINAATIFSVPEWGEVHNIELEAHKVMYRAQANALGPNNAAYAQLSAEAQWGYNPTLSDGKTFTATGAPADLINPAEAYDRVSEDAATAHMVMSPGLIRSAKRIEALTKGFANGAGVSYGFTTGGLGGTSFGAGDGGADGSTGYNDGVNEAHQQAQKAADDLFGGGTHVDLPGEGYAGSGQSAFADFRGGGPNTINTGVPMWGDQGWGDYENLQGQVQQNQPRGGWIPDDSPQAQAQDVADQLENARLRGQTGTEATLQSMNGYTPDMGSARPNSSYSDLNGNWKPPVQRDDGAAEAMDNEMSKWGSPQALLNTLSGTPQKTDISLSDDVFNQDEKTFTSYQKALTMSKQFTPQSQIDNSGLTEGFINGRLRKFADGGRPEAGVPSIVGENGPEIFTPDVAGRITPNDEAFGGNFTVNHMIFNQASNLVSVHATTDRNGLMKTFIKAIAADAANGGRVLQGVNKGNTRVAR